MTPGFPKPKIRAFSLEELAFFWNPRRWIPDIVARFDWPGSSDVRDAIIMLDDEGGYGFLHWYADRASWGLTGKGKRWVEDLLSKPKLRRAMAWQAPPKEPKVAEAEPIREPRIEEVPAVLPEVSREEVAEAVVLTREEELAALVADQVADQD